MRWKSWGKIELKNFQRIENWLDNDYVKEIAWLKNEVVQTWENYDKLLKDANLEIIWLK